MRSGPSGLALTRFPAIVAENTVSALTRNGVFALAGPVEMQTR